MTIIEEESFLSSFEVEGSEVHIYCVISLKNNSDDSQKIKLTGDFQEEVKGGLLTEGNLEACFIENGTDTVVINGEAEKKYMEVLFVGEYAGKPAMSSRVLPDIEVVEVH